MSDTRDLERLQDDSQQALCDFEIEVLKECAGLPSTITTWGAALGVCAGDLASDGYLTRGSYHITEAGKQLLKERGCDV